MSITSPPASPLDQGDHRIVLNRASRPRCSAWALSPADAGGAPGAGNTLGRNGTP
jgi:hypothetical protein